MSIHGWNNASCVKCDKVEKYMVRVGAIVFCTKCCKEEFGTEDPVRLEKDVYRKWLKVWYDKCS